MPIFNPGAGAPPKETVLTPTPSSSQTYETKTYPKPQITDIEGIPWVNTYYNSILTGGESPQPLDPNLDPTLQQYLKVTDFRISVTEDLSYSHNDDTNLSTLTGGGLIYPSTVVPHEGDMFVGYIEAGRKGIFTVTNVTPLGYYKQTVYQIEYTLYSDDVDAYQGALDTRAVQYRYFDVKRLTAGYSPLIEYDVANSERNYYSVLKRLIGKLYNRYYSKRYRTFVVGTDETYYDHFAVNFFNAAVPKSLLGSYPVPYEYTVGTETETIERNTLWSALLLSDVELLSTMPRHYDALNVNELNGIGSYVSAGSSGIDYTYLPDQWWDQPIKKDVAPYLYSHALYDDSEDITEVERGMRELISGNGISNVLLSTIIAEAEEATGIDQLRKLILLVGILKFKLVGL